MSKSKSIFVTVIMTVMLAAIVVGLYTIQFRAFLIFLGLLGAYGFLCVAVNFYRWLGEESPLMPAHADKNVQGEPVGGLEFVPAPEYYGTYEQIKREMEGETV